MMKHRIALVPAAGVGIRFGAEQPKQYLQLAGQSILAHTLQRLARSGCFDALAVVLSPQDNYFDALSLPAECVRVDDMFRLPESSGKPYPLYVLRCGGETRARSVAGGVHFLLERGIIGDQDQIAVHDAARCCIDTASLRRLIAAACADGALLAIPVADTLKHSDDQHRVAHTLSREKLWQAQTPQIFSAALLRQALAEADLDTVTDEASAVEALGYTPQLVQGDVRNFKLTVAADMALVSTLLKEDMMEQRIGQGYDVHCLVENRPLILGGVHIPFGKGLAGHSDADVLLHALTDALLGAAGLGDIGTHFPDTDPAYAGADSRELLRHAYAKVTFAGWCLRNTDCTIIAQQPKLAPYINAMRNTIAADLQVDASQINIKGKTNEKLGYLGREEAIEAQAAVLLMR